jgi:orotate phosphoribosyltransferase
VGIVSIREMGKPELLALAAGAINRPLTTEEVLHIAMTLGAFWAYDYRAAKQGRVGKHAVLKSGLHSDGFFVSRILLASENIRRVISAQMARKITDTVYERVLPDCVAGVPDGATKLGEDIAAILGAGAEVLKMEKRDGRITLSSAIDSRARVLVVEDFCTRGTGFTEAVHAIKQAQPEVRFVHCDPVIINRGGLKNITVEGVGGFFILPVVEWRVQDWEPAECPLCKICSVPIKPKATDENWQELTTSQL